MVLTTLIDKQDTAEIIRDQIAAILAFEVANQKTLAIAASKDPALWDLKIYTERSNPWEQFLSDNPDPTPIVNVWFDNESFDKTASNVVERQKATGVFNIDCYGFGISADDGTGHKPGDREAAFEVQRAIRLVRNILMSAENTYLQLPRGTAWDRFPGSITSFQPAIDSQQVQQIVGARILFNVSYNEFSPQIEGDILELLSVDVNRTEDGQIVVEADYNYPLP
ncbi:MAG: hypothetical protein K0U20_09035 [Proteobacteria bacterium]|nr:hypothetical protein [Pseudomonadota bacterium]